MTAFPDIQFAGQLRPSQQEVAEIARSQLAQGEKRLHIVAPPGSGKTVLGLYLWAHCVRQPALVLSPNSAIQMQWAARTDLFAAKDHSSLSGHVSTDGEQPGLLTSLTYQSVTLPRRGEDLDQAALDRWIERLVENEHVGSEAEAKVWIEDLERNNPEYHQQRLAACRKEIREAATLGGESLQMLHSASLATLQRIRDAGVGLIILDECHHLMGHWGRVLADAHDLLEQPIVVGLTATPPDEGGKKTEDVERYQEFFGPVDFEVPVPAVVKDGFLAPYQDLAYFVRPTSEEIQFIAGVDEQLQSLVNDLCNPEHPEPLPAWVSRVLRERKLGATVTKNWSELERRDPSFATLGPAFLQRRGLAIPQGVPAPERTVLEQTSEFDLLATVVDRYIRHHLRRSEDPENHERAQRAIAGLRMLGVQVTETGTQPCASPVARVMAYSLSKTEALRTILTQERRELGDAIRAVVVADYEKTSAVTAEIQHLMDDEAGGAVAAFKALLGHEATDALDPVLVTGSSVLVDDDLADAFMQAAVRWLGERRHNVELEYAEREGFMMLIGRGSDWSPRVYIQLVTDLFQQGLTKCLVGTRGLLGEGWDANKINVLVDLTCVTTSMSVNQLRGRSIRLDPDQPRKLANNWDVVCVAPEFARGLDDYDRFRRKHKTIFGVTDDGAIEKGVGHVHAAFTELKPEGVEGSAAAINSDMLARIGRRDEARELWKIGQPYHPEPVRTVEIKLGGGGGGFPPLPGRREAWSSGSLTAAIGEAVLAALRETKMIGSGLGVHRSDRDGGYVRLFLEDASEGDAAIFSAAISEAVGPLDQPRYVIPRSVDHYEETLLSRLLPSIVGQYFRNSRREMVMLHAVPSVLAKKRQVVDIYQRHWNAHVSPGEALFAHRGAGEELLQKSREQNMVPEASVHEKEVFLSQTGEAPTANQ